MPSPPDTATACVGSRNPRRDRPACRPFGPAANRPSGTERRELIAGLLSIDSSRRRRTWVVGRAGRSLNRTVRAGLRPTIDGGRPSGQSERQIATQTRLCDRPTGIGTADANRSAGPGASADDRSAGAPEHRLSGDVSRSVGRAGSAPARPPGGDALARQRGAGRLGTGPVARAECVRQAALGGPSRDRRGCVRQTASGGIGSCARSARMGCACQAAWGELAQNRRGRPNGRVRQTASGGLGTGAAVRAGCVCQAVSGGMAGNPARPAEWGCVRQAVSGGPSRHRSGRRAGDVAASSIRRDGSAATRPAQAGCVRQVAGRSGRG